MAVKGLLRQMIGAYLSRPDPVGWCAAADLLEEQGRDREAIMWRNRGRFYPVVLAAVEKAEANYPATVRFGSLSIDFHRKKKTFKLVFRFDDALLVASTELWARFSVDPQQYLTRNIIRLIDMNAHRINEVERCQK